MVSVGGEVEGGAIGRGWGDRQEGERGQRARPIFGSRRRPEPGPSSLIPAQAISIFVSKEDKTLDSKSRL